MSTARNNSPDGGITFPHPFAFWTGAAAIITGVLLHFPDFVAMSDMGWMMVGMPVSPIMLLGMGLIVGGLGLAGYGLIPRAAKESSLARGAFHFRAMDEAKLTRAHWGLLFVLGIALVVDVMKPATLGFTVPGMKSEYGITTAQAALLPLTALTGTTLGSLFWGMLADRMGRRASILLASLIFMGTAICGFMTGFAGNLFMCFLMGMAAGGMLPIVYALMSESVPSKRRGWLVVLHGGMGTVGGYLAAAGLATLLEPAFSWRMLWVVNLPTGALVLLLNRWIPESPRFLLERGRRQEAQHVMSRYGVVLEEVDATLSPQPDEAPPSRGHGSLAGLRKLFQTPHLPQTLVVGSYGLGWGLVNWGFITFVPTMLADAGLESGVASRLLFISALIAVPGTVLVAYLYGLWSSRKSMILYALLTAVSLLGFAALRPTGGAELTMLMVLLLVSSGGVISMLSPYTAEVYPTMLRGTASGLAAGSSKLGGMIGPPLLAALITIAPGFTLPALVVAVPIAVSALVLKLKGIETKDRRLEEIGASSSVGSADISTAEGAA